MPNLIHQKKDKPGVYEVAWTWMPYFLAADRELHRAVDQELTRLYQGDSPGLRFVNQTVIRLCCERYPYQGLQEALQALVEVQTP